MVLTLIPLLLGEFSPTPTHVRMWTTSIASLSTRNDVGIASKLDEQFILLFQTRSTEHASPNTSSFLRLSLSIERDMHLANTTKGSREKLHNFDVFVDESLNLFLGMSFESHKFLVETQRLFSNEHIRVRDVAPKELISESFIPFL